MADPIVSILLIPADAHREALLGAAFSGSYPPMMWPRTEYSPHPGQSVTRWTAPLPGRGGSLPDGWDARTSPALVLAFGGKVVREGRDRLGYVFARQRWPGVHRPILGYGTTWGATDAALFNTAKVRPKRWALMCDEADDCEDFEVEPLEDLADDLLCAWALATICAARGLGRVCLLDSDGREVKP